MIRVAGVSMLLMALISGCGDQSDGVIVEERTTSIGVGIDASNAPEATTETDVRPEPLDPEDPAGFTIRGDTATMSGLIDSRFDETVRDLFEHHPEVSRIVLTIAPGSADDDANLRAARLVRDAGVTTEVLADSEIASGAVDLFLAGETRIVASGARLGVHSWGADDFAGQDLPDDDPEHDRYLEYYDEMGIDQEFYWFTLDAAGPDDIHWMTSSELAEFGFATQ